MTYYQLLETIVSSYELINVYVSVEKVSALVIPTLNEMLEIGIAVSAEARVSNEL